VRIYRRIFNEIRRRIEIVFVQGGELIAKIISLTNKIRLKREVRYKK
jgi:hypothetical protein